MVFKNTVMKQLKVEHNAQPSSDLACLEVKTANESFKDATPREEEELHQIPRLFALIIGINVYQMKHRTLRGAVPDGMAFKSYLMKRLCVPKNQIITLFDHDATRTVIIEHGFRKLRDRLDVGFFKLYLSTKPIDLSGIKQPSAFLETCTTSVWQPKPEDLWDTILIPVIQRRNQVAKFKLSWSNSNTMA